MKNKTKTISGNKKPAKIVKKKTSPPKKSLLSRKKKAKKTIKNKPVLKNSAILKKHTTKPSNIIIVEKYRDILESIEDGYFEVDLAGNFTFLNDSVCRVTGYSREELMGMNNRQYTDEENLKIVFKAFNKVYKTGKPLKEFGWYITRKDGSRRYIEGFISLLKNSSGKPTGFRGIARDISERKRTEEALSASETRYRRLFESAKDGILILDANKGIILDVNPFLIDLLGYSREQLIGKAVWELGPFKDIIPHRNKFLELQKQGYIRYENLPLETIDGRLANVEFVSNVYAVDHTMIIQCNIRDITERRQAESQREAALELLKQSEAKYRLLADHMKDYVWLMDLNLKWTYISPSAEKLLGYTLEELKQLPLDKLLTARSFQQAMDVFLTEVPKALAQTFPSSYKTLLELECRRKDGRTLWIESTLSFIQDDDGKPVTILGEGRDITERKRMEEVIRQNEEKYRTILESFQEGYFEVDLTGNFSFCNDSMSRLTGYFKEELLGMNYRVYTDEETEIKVYQEFNKVYTTGEPSKGFDWPFIRKNGTKGYVEASIILQKDSSGKPTGFKGMARDVTERKRVERKLIDSEEKFRMLAESSSFAIMMHQGDHCIYANRAAEEISGYTEEELYSMHFWDIVHPDYRDMVKQSAYHRQQGKLLPRAYEFKIIAKNGVEKWVSLSGNLIQYEDKPTALISVEDVTERKITEAALRENEIKYRRIFESFEDLYYQTDENGIIRVLSPSLYRLTGWFPDELIGKPVSDIYVRPEDRKDLLAELSTNGLVRDYEVFLKKKDGTQTYASLTASILTDPDGRPNGIAGTLRDITERKRAEETLRESEHRYLELSIIDDLTQLYNSRHFYAQLEKEIERSNRYGQPLTLLLLDLDRFKDFNDAYGHVKGDYVLSRLGHAIKRSLREIDSAYRYGGEEFTIILPMTMSEEGIVTAKRIQKEFRKENLSLVAGQEVYMTVSIGLAQYKPKEEIKTFVHRVDQFMYKVKKTGRGKICADDGDLR